MLKIVLKGKRLKLVKMIKDGNEFWIEAATFRDEQDAKFAANLLVTALVEVNMPYQLEGDDSDD